MIQALQYLQVRLNSYYRDQDRYNILAYGAKRTTEIKDHRKLHQRSRRTEMAWSLHQQTTPRQTTASHSQLNPEEREKYTWYCPQSTQDHTTTTATKSRISKVKHRWSSQTPVVQCCTAQESTTHLLNACSNIAKTLYTASHDRMLRPIYHCLLNSTIYRKVTMQSHGTNRAYSTQCLKKKMRRRGYIRECTLYLWEATGKWSL